MFISFLNMFRATICTSSRETTVFMRNSVIVILCGWLSGMQGGCIPDSHPYRITSTKHRVNTFVSPDDRHIFTRNDINILRIIVHQIDCIYKIFVTVQALTQSMINRQNNGSTSVIRTKWGELWSGILGNPDHWEKIPWSR
jgi:hypothetical protein